MSRPTGTTPTSRLMLLALLFCLAAPGQTRMTVEQLLAFVKSSVQMKHNDKDVADILKRVKLTNRLEDQDIEDLQNMGAGPKTVAALRTLRDSSTSLAPPPPPQVKVPPPPLPSPDSIEQKRVLSQVTEYAVNYTKRLPDFICTQVTRRFVDPRGGESWIRRDVITEKLSYAEHKEDYTVVLVNDTPVTNVKHEQLGGATSSGEFGTMLSEIFAPDTEAQFEWERWGKIRGHLMHVYSYKVDQGRSKYRITAYQSESSSKSMIIGYHGLIYVDTESITVRRITLASDDIPPSFPIQDVRLELDYDVQEVGPSKFVLPLKSTLRSRQEARVNVKNDIEFHNYRKFGTESTIIYTPDPLPEDKEQAVKPDAPPAKPKP